MLKNVANLGLGFIAKSKSFGETENVRARFCKIGLNSEIDFGGICATPHTQTSKPKQTYHLPTGNRSFSTDLKGFFQRIFLECQLHTNFGLHRHHPRSKAQFFHGCSAAAFELCAGHVHGWVPADAEQATSSLGTIHVHWLHLVIGFDKVGLSKHQFSLSQWAPLFFWLWISHRGANAVSAATKMQTSVTPEAKKRTWNSFGNLLEWKSSSKRWPFVPVSLQLWNFPISVGRLLKTPTRAVPSMCSVAIQKNIANCHGFSITPVIALGFFKVDSFNLYWTYTRIPIGLPAGSVEYMDMDFWNTRSCFTCIDCIVKHVKEKLRSAVININFSSVPNCWAFTGFTSCMLLFCSFSWPSSSSAKPEHQKDIPLTLDLRC